MRDESAEDESVAPDIPAALRTQLLRELAAARDAVAADANDDRARRRLRDARLASRPTAPRAGTAGERSAAAERIEATVRALLRQRAATSSICPSEAARVVGGERWRELMPLTREVAWRMAAAGGLRVTRRDEPLDAPVDGPIRLSRCRDADRPVKRDS